MVNEANFNISEFEENEVIPHCSRFALLTQPEKKKHNQQKKKVHTGKKIVSRIAIEFTMA